MKRGMNRYLLTALLFITALMTSCSAFNSKQKNEGIQGLWFSRDQHSDKTRSLVAIYEYQGKFYGRMLQTYGENGEVNDTIFEKKGRAPGVVGDPPYCGMDFIYNVKKEEGKERYKGKIIDPEKGEVYTAEFWIEGNRLIVRGEVWIFGENIPWKRASKKDLPKGFKMSEIKSFVPVIPIVQ